MNDLSVVRQSSAEHRLMNEIDPELRRVRAVAMGHVISELIFLLVAIHRERGDRRDELIVAKSFKA